MEKSGYIALHRKLLEWEWFADGPVLRLFIYLLLRANHKPQSWRGLEIKRGQLVSGIYRLAEDTGLSVQETRTALKKLKKSGNLTSHATNRFTIYTIEKYSDYQRNGDEATSHATNKQQTSNKQATTNNNDNNDNKKERGRKTSRFCPPSVDEVRDYMRKIKAEGFTAEQFVDHYTANGWMRGKTKIKDWHASVRLWKTNNAGKVPKPQGREHHRYRYDQAGNIIGEIKP